MSPLLRTARGARRRGFALADFVAGALIFSATLGAFVALTNDKFQLLRSADLRARAQVAAEARLDALRLEGLPGLPAGEADAEGFRRVATFAPEPRVPAGEGLVEARSLVVEGGDSHRLYEARVTVRFEETPGDPRTAAAVRLSTVVPLPPGEGGR